MALQAANKQAAEPLAPNNHEANSSNNGSNSNQQLMSSSSQINFQANQQQQQSSQSQPQQRQQNCCASCQMPIKDRFIFSVIEQNFHQDCVRCSDCLASLNERCFTFEGKLYCRADYWRRFGPKCSACEEPIKATELVQRLKENLVYHLNCFVCHECKRHLRAGEQLHLIDEKRLLCKRDFIAMSQQQQSLGIGGRLLGANGTPTATVSPATAVAAAPTPNGRGLPLGALATSAANQEQNQENQLQQQHELADTSSNASELPLPVGDQLEAEELLDELDDGQSSTADGVEQSALYSSFGNSKNEDNNNNNGSKTGSLSNQTNSDSLNDDGLVDANGKRRGPRTTIKPKQLETLRHAFEEAPKPSRHTREQLAAQTGLNMRVIQVWFQNRRSKERRMKNSNGSARRNFFRSSSRRIRVGPGGPTGANQAGAPLANGQQSLIAAAGGRAKAPKAAPIGSPAMEPAISGGEHPQQQLQQQQAQQQLAARQQQPHNSPSEFGGSSSGGFTYFSDSSNQGDAFAINTGGQQATGQKQQQRPPSQTIPAPYQLHQDQAALMALESPSGGQGNPQQQQQQQSGQQQQQQATSARPSQQQQQQQYGHHSMKNTPPPPTQSLYPPGGQHMLMGGGGGALPVPQQHPAAHLQHHQQAHPTHQHLAPPSSMMQPGMGGLLGHPSVVQW